VNLIDAGFNFVDPPALQDRREPFTGLPSRLFPFGGKLNIGGVAQ
jgi:hypothetical protein